MALRGLLHPVGNQTALKSVYACRCTRLGRVTSTRRLCVRVAGNANRRAGCVTSAPLLAQRGGWEHCPGPDGLRNLRPRLCGGGWEHCLLGGLRNPSPLVPRRQGRGNTARKSYEYACRCSSDGLRNLLSRLRGCGWEHHLPGGLRNPSPRCFGVGEGGTLPGKNHKSQLAAGSKADGLRNLQSRLRGCGGNTIPPGRLRNLAPGACARGRGNTARVS